MPLEPGARLGPYEIIAPIGAGGMGEVYRARDTRLDRAVAVKVLTGALAADPESRQRFEQEARAIAALNDPHICTIHDVGRHEDHEYLVLEHLEGETLADRLRRAPGLSVDESIAIAVQIADGLDRAHRAGIVHRDLKPGNVMLLGRSGPGGSPAVKLLDFGLAARMPVERPAALDASLTATIATSQVATRPGTTPVATGFSGTVQYVAPEQIDGKVGDHRTDIFAFGCVLYEMLAGRKAFEGSSAVTVIAAITSSEPPSVAALASAHPLLDHVLRRCLEKDPERRWQSIADAGGELRWIANQPIATAAVSGRRAASRFERGAIALIIVLAAIAALAGWRALRTQRAPREVPTLRFEISAGSTDDPSLALSPDGGQIAFIANQNGQPMLWIRPGR